MHGGELAVVLVSGGIDSCVTAAIAQRSHRLAFLHANYGQRTERRESKHSTISPTTSTLSSVLSYPWSTSPASADPASPIRPFRSPRPICGHKRSRHPMSLSGMRTSLSVAVSWAEVLGCPAVFIGAVEEDSSGYPDCRRSFFEAFNAVIREGTKPDSQFRIVTPLIDMTKAESFTGGWRTPRAAGATWSCYQREDVACGMCDSCALRAARFPAMPESPTPFRMPTPNLTSLPETRPRRGRIVAFSLRNRHGSNSKNACPS